MDLLYRKGGLVELGVSATFGSCRRDQFRPPQNPLCPCLAIQYAASRRVGRRGALTAEGYFFSLNTARPQFTPSGEWTSAKIIKTEKRPQFTPSGERTSRCSDLTR